MIGLGAGLVFSGAFSDDTVVTVSSLNSETQPQGDSLGSFAGANNTAKRPTTPSEITNDVGMEFQLIPAGSFKMGSPASEKLRDDDEDQHSVEITGDYYVGVTEVTQGQWKAVMGTDPWKGKDNVEEGDDYPAVYVSWEDAVEFCRKLSKREGKEYRLPTEAEWEYACRGGTGTAYSFGDDASELGQNGWFDENADYNGEKYAHEVGQKRANAFGLYDMHGNVREWCSDWYGGDYYAGSPRRDPVGPASGSSRVLRGGSWYDNATLCRSAYRNSFDPANRDGNIGFRVVVLFGG